MEWSLRLTEQQKLYAYNQQLNIDYLTPFIIDYYQIHLIHSDYRRLADCML